MNNATVKMMYKEIYLIAEKDTMNFVTKYQHGNSAPRKAMFCRYRDAMNVVSKLNANETDKYMIYCVRR